MKISDTVFDPTNLDPSFDFVFRDFERSRLVQIRGLLAADRGTLSLIYFAVVVFWTIAMSYGAIAHGHGGFAVNLSPHVAFYTLIIGIILYPIRKMWIPIGAFSTVYFIPFFLPHASGATWMTLTQHSPGLLAAVYVGHIATGTLIALVSMQVAKALQRLSPPYSVDLLNVLTMYFAFVLFCLLQAWAFWFVAQSLSMETRSVLGFGAQYMPAIIERVLRGGVVASGFLLGVLQVSGSKEVINGVIASAVFLALALAHSAGFALYPTLDACLLALLLTTILPFKTGVTACILGIPVYSALTGTFVSINHLNDPFQTKLEYLAIILLVIIVLSPTLRAQTLHLLHQREGAMRRLSMVRDFANVGLLSFNLDHQIFRTDTSVQRILGTQSFGTIADFLNFFQEKDQDILRQSLTKGQSGSVNLLMQRLQENDHGQVLRMCLWHETAPSGESVAYGLILDVTGEHEQERALQETLAELSLRQERQRQLFSIVSHELRTPASVISMLVDDLDDTDLPAKTIKQLHDATDQLMSTLADMRQTVNPTQNLPITQVQYSPAELADSLRNMFEPKARDNGMTIQLNLADAARAQRFGDQRRIRQALSNLLRNAILHSGAKTVELGFSERQGGDGICISRWTVTDNGRGIAESAMAKMFEPFERGPQDPRSHVDGSGLGLYIVKSSITTLGGTLTHFVPRFGGTGYVIEIPEDKLQPSAIKPTQPRKRKAPANLPDFCVVLAEDNALVAEVTMAKLQRFVGKVELVVNGRAALERCLASPPDLLITDLFMPEMDGDALIATLRGSGVQIPIVGLTAAAVGDDIDRLKVAGATSVMVKPLDMDLLQTLIRNIAQEKRDDRNAAQDRHRLDTAAPAFAAVQRQFGLS